MNSTWKGSVQWRFFLVFLGIGKYGEDTNDETFVIGEEVNTGVDNPEKQFGIQIMEDFFTNDDAGVVQEKGLIVASVECKLFYGCSCTVLCYYDATNILQNNCTAHPWGQDVSFVRSKCGPLFTAWMDVLPQDLMKSESCEIRV